MNRCMIQGCERKTSNSGRAFCDDCHRAYVLGESESKTAEQWRIKANIMSRVTDLKCCGKDDNCHELGTLIESYIPEWLGDHE